MLMLVMLVGCGANTNSLMKAIETSDITKVETIAKKININEKAENGDIPIIKAIKNGNLEIVELLINAGAKCDITDAEQNTPLHVSISEGKDDITNLLLTKENVVDKKNAQGKTPFDIAEDIQNYALLAKISYDKGQNDNVLKYGELAVAKNDEDTSSTYYLGTIALNQSKEFKNSGNLEEAISSTEKAIGYFDKILSVKPSSDGTIELKTESQTLLDTLNSELNAKREAERIEAEKKAAEEKAALKKKQQQQTTVKSPVANGSSSNKTIATAEDFRGNAISVGDTVIRSSMLGNVKAIDGTRLKITWFDCVDMVGNSKRDDSHYVTTVTLMSGTPLNSTSWHEASTVGVY